MPARKYTDEQIGAALELYVEHGPAAAARMLKALGVGMTSTYIRKQASRRGVTVTRDAHAREATEAAAVTRAHRSAQLADDMLTKAVRLVEDIYNPTTLYFPMPKSEFVIEHNVAHPPPGDQEKLARAASTLLEKVELLSGRATGRTEVVGTPEQAEGRIIQLTEVLKRRAAEHAS